LLDTPGLLDPKHLLQHAMLRAARAALRDADVVVHLVDATDKQVDIATEHKEIARVAGNAHIILALNKVDAISAARRSEMAAVHAAAALVSARRGDGVDALMDLISSQLPESPFLYPADDASSQPVRFFARELIREAATEAVSAEVPYSVACEIEEFRDGSTPVYIRAVLFVERESQKAIVVGAKGAKIREIGSSARRKIEELVGVQVYLDLHVKVLPNWRRDSAKLRKLGYNVGEEKK
jgi:GTP-binding protein Era